MSESRVGLPVTGQRGHGKTVISVTPPLRRPKVRNTVHNMWSSVLTWIYAGLSPPGYLLRNDQLVQQYKGTDRYHRAPEANGGVWKEAYKLASAAVDQMTVREKVSHLCVAFEQI